MPNLPRCDCHECTQARAKETNIFTTPTLTLEQVKQSFPPCPWCGVVNCGKTHVTCGGSNA